MFSFTQVVDVLARIHGVPDHAMKAFRARIQHLQRLGIVPASPGKGKKIDYQIYDLYKWAICIEFANFGMDPTLVKKLLSEHWADIHLTLYRHVAEPYYLYFFPALATAATGSSVTEKAFHAFSSRHSDFKLALEDCIMLTGGVLTPDLKAAFAARHGVIDTTYIPKRVDKALYDIQFAGER